MTTKTALFTAATLLSSAAAHANVNFGIIINGLNDAKNQTPSQASIRTVMFIDKDGSAPTDFKNWDGKGFAPLTDGDILVWSDEFTNDGDGFEGSPKIPAALLPGIVDANANGLTNIKPAPGNADIYLLWFPELDVKATEAGAGTVFGSYYVGKVPPKGFGSLAPSLLSTKNAFAAEHVTTPEPTSLALLGLGGLLVARRRRG